MPDSGTPASPHHALDNALQAEIWLMGCAPRMCTVSKVANNLIFLSVNAGDDHHGQPSPQEELADLMIRQGDSRSLLRIRTRISNCTRERWVLEPIHANLPLLPALKKALKQGNNKTPGATLNLKHLRRAQILRRCRWVTTQYLTDCYAGFYSGLDDALFIAAATSSDRKNEFLVAVKLIEQSHVQLEHGFIDRVCWLIDVAAEPDFEPADADFSSGRRTGGNRKQTSGSMRLSLELLSKQAANRNETVLDTLAQRFSSIVLRLCSDTALPFGPAWLCRHFGDSIAALDLSGHARQVLYGVFRDTVLAGIGALYEQLNTVFSEHQILPELEQSPLARVLRGPDALSMPRFARDKPVATAAAVLATRWENGSADSHSSELLRAACDLWATLHGDADATNKPAAASLGVDSRARVAVVDALFTAICGDEKNADAARELLEKMSQPLMKTALTDSSFFTEPQHTARQCLNLFARLCRESHFSNAMVRRQLQAVCERICQQNEPATYEALLTPLRELAARQQQARERNINRVAAMQDGQYQLHQAHAEVEEQLYQHYAGKIFPEILLELLDCGWHTYMIRTLLKRGADSEQWQHCVTVLHDLYYTLLPDEQQQGLSRPATEIRPEGLLPLLEQPLERLGINTIQYQNTVQKLATALQQPARTSVLTAYPDRRTSTDPVAKSARVVADRWLNRCRELKPGDWLGWQENPLEAPLQLAWIASDYSRYVMVNEQGHQRFDWSVATMANNMQQGLQQGPNPDAWPVVDDALYAIAQSLYRQLDQASRLDPLTGLLQHRAFETQLAELTRLARHSDERHSLIGVSVDQFAELKSQHSPQAIAQLLSDTAILMHALCPEPAVVTGIGEHQFAVLLPYQDGQCVLELAESIRATLQHSDSMAALNTSASLAIVNPGDQSSCITSLLNQMHCLLRQAQQSGGNQVRRHEPGEAPGQQQEMLDWITQLGEILQQDRLRLRCQTIVPLCDEPQAHHEILLGVAAADGSVMLPGELITAAEQYNRMDIIDRWVVQRTSRWLRENPEKAAQLGTVHINLSGNSIGNDLFLNFLLAELDRGNLTTAQFCFEIAATTAIVNPARVADFIARLQARGCKFALDNFGRGWSCLNDLRQLPVDYIKIDGTIVSTMEREPAALARIDAINRIAHCSGKHTIAVCVENEMQLQLLEDRGVEFAQGFGVAKPTLLSEI